MARFAKGSKEAKEHMARLRSLRGTGTAPIRRIVPTDERPSHRRDTVNDVADDYFHLREPLRRWIRAYRAQHETTLDNDTEILQYLFKADPNYFKLMTRRYPVLDPTLFNDTKMMPIYTQVIKGRGNMLSANRRVGPEPSLTLRYDVEGDLHMREPLCRWMAAAQRQQLQLLHASSSAILKRIFDDRDLQFDIIMENPELSSTADYFQHYSVPLLQRYVRLVGNHY